MLSETFAEFAVGARNKGLDDEVYKAATRALVDWSAATIAGADMEPARVLRRALAVSGDAGAATLLADGARTDARAAALINATASHTAELDDIYREGVYHPGSPTIGAALAAAELLKCSGEELLRAIAVGYEIGDRIAAAVQPSHYTFWHTTGTVGPMGAAAAVAELLELDSTRFAHAIATATTNAAGLQQAFRSDSMSKPLHAGHAAEAGLVAALAAGEGFTGALDILEGPAGFGAATSRDVDWGAVAPALGSPWGITEATVKNHSCCGHIFAAVDAALELRAEGVRAEKIDRIEVDTYTTATQVAGYLDPVSTFEAKFSIPYCVAAAFTRGAVRLPAFSDESLADLELRRILSATTLRPSNEYERDFPGRRRANVTAHLRDGSSVSRERNTRKGDPDDPLSNEELEGKFLDLAVPVLGEDAARQMSTKLWNARTAPSVRDAFLPPIEEDKLQ